MITKQLNPLRVPIVLQTEDRGGGGGEGVGGTGIGGRRIGGLKSDRQGEFGGGGYAIGLSVLLSFLFFIFVAPVMSPLKKRRSEIIRVQYVDTAVGTRCLTVVSSLPSSEGARIH